MAAHQARIAHSLTATGATRKRLPRVSSASSAGDGELLIARLEIATRNAAQAGRIVNAVINSGTADDS